jgi:multiple sugar transport system substrate-binding protein
MEARRGEAKKVFTVLLTLLAGGFLIAFWFLPHATEATKPARKKVVFWHMWTAEWKDVVDKVVARFNASQTEYEVEALSVPTAGADSKFVLGVMGGDPPDLMAQWNPVIPSWADDHLLTPLDDLMSPSERDHFYRDAYPVVKKVGSYHGKLYGMSIGMNMVAVYMLPQQLRDAGIDPDKSITSLEQMDEIGAKLNRFDSNHNLTRIGWFPSNIGEFAPLFGGGFYDWKANRLSIVTPQNLAALTYLANQRKALGYDQVVRFSASLDVNSFAGGWPFISGVYSALPEGQWRVEQLEKFAPKLEYRTFPVPSPKGGVPNAGISGGNFMIVPRGAKQPKGAWEFIKFWSGLSDPDRAAEFYTWGGWLPLTPQVANAPLYRAYLKKFPQFKTFVDLMPSPAIQVAPPVPFSEFLNDEITKMEDSAERGTMSPKQALETLSAKIEAELSRRRELGQG